MFGFAMDSWSGIFVFLILFCVPLQMACNIWLSAATHLAGIYWYLTNTTVSFSVAVTISELFILYERLGFFFLVGADPIHTVNVICGFTAQLFNLTRSICSSLQPALVCATSNNSASAADLFQLFIWWTGEAQETLVNAKLPQGT